MLITEDFVRRAAQLPKLCPQFHMSLQSGCDATLAADEPPVYHGGVPSRRGPAAEKPAGHGHYHGPDGWLSRGDRREFRQSYDFCAEIGFSQMHVFPYSIRQGTAAAGFPDRWTRL